MLLGWLSIWRGEEGGKEEITVMVEVFVMCSVLKGNPGI